MSLEIESVVFSQTSVPAQHPTADVFVKPGYVLTGGGAYLNYQEPGNLLTQSYPIQGPDGTWSGWRAYGKDCWVASRGTITTYAIGLRITRDGQPVPIQQTVFTARGGQADLPATPDHDGWIGVGGGVKCDQNIYENVILAETAPMRGNADGSKPTAITSWFGANQYCCSPTSSRGPAGGGTITSHLIAIRVKDVQLSTTIHSAQGTTSSRPTAEVSANGGVVVSGGALDKQSSGGFGSHVINMLTATYPVYDPEQTNRITGWAAAGKDHHYTSPSVVRAYVVTLSTS